MTQGHWTLALADYVAGWLETCVTHARRALAMWPRFAVHYIVLAACLAELCELSEAHYTLVAAQALAPGLVESRLAGNHYTPTLRKSGKNSLPTAVKAILLHP